ncbi:hypothetical protein P1X15_30975 [Runella sp. MFBS21]|uniref:hypothetical protein n=1 Tax=Runella sp. MFBS21 TaxID=3034018 RepID=UPI0023FA287C|nr:hypothetical protein [Runella sp. MFBS21]MDF7822080.1 hypothetical protein [Runella sp. MFBS21]
MMNQLTPNQKRQLAAALFSYFGDRHPTRTWLKQAYETQKYGHERTLLRKMENQGAKLSEADADWVIDNLIPKFDPLHFRTLFIRTLNAMPEEFGYSLPAPNSLTPA